VGTYYWCQVLLLSTSWKLVWILCCYRQECWYPTATLHSITTQKASVEFFNMFSSESVKVLHLGFDCIDFSTHQTMCLAPIGSAKTTWPLGLGRASWKITYPMAVFSIMLQVGIRRYLSLIFHYFNYGQNALNYSCLHEVLIKYWSSHMLAGNVIEFITLSWLSSRFNIW